MRLAIIGVTTLALAACGNKTERTLTAADGSTVKVEQKDGQEGAKISSTSGDDTATITTGGAGQWPAGLADQS